MSRRHKSPATRLFFQKLVHANKNIITGLLREDSTDLWREDSLTKVMPGWKCSKRSQCHDAILLESD